MSCTVIDSTDSEMPSWTTIPSLSNKQQSFTYSEIWEITHGTQAWARLGRTTPQAALLNIALCTACAHSPSCAWNNVTMEVTAWSINIFV